MKSNPLIFLTLGCLVISAGAGLVPNGDFQMYKPGTGYTVTATFADGASFARGVGDGIDLAGGTVNYSDLTSSVAPNDAIADIDVPGWVPLQSGNDLVGNGVDGSTGMNLFAAWGGDGRIQSASSLGTVQAGGVYTISVMVGGPDDGPIQGPLAFHLLADGVQLTPTSSVNPTLPGAGVFQTISRTYEGAAIADHIGKSLTIVLGVEDANDFGNRVIFDNVSIEGIATGPPPPLRLVISPTAGSPGNYDFAWDSQEGKLYDLVSATDLETAPNTWPVWDGRANLIATPPGNTLTGIPGGGDPRRFFVLIERNAPPLPLPLAKD